MVKISHLEKERHFVATAYIVKDGKVLLVDHKKLKSWLPPGGHIEKGETPDQAILREIKEETGFDAEIIGLGKYPGEDHRTEILGIPHHIQLEEIDNEHQHIDLTYLCRLISGKSTGKPDEKFKWFSIEEIMNTPRINENVKFFATKFLNDLKQ